MHLFEYDIIDNPFILKVKDNRVIICNEVQPNVVQRVIAPFSGSYTEIHRENGTFSISKRGYTLYGNLVSFDEKNRLKSHIEGGNVLGVTTPYLHKGKMYQVVELWIHKNEKSVDNAQYLYKRDQLEVIKNEKSVDNNIATIKSDNKRPTTNKTQDLSVGDKPIQRNAKRRKK